MKKYIESISKHSTLRFILEITTIVILIRIISVVLIYFISRFVGISLVNPSDEMNILQHPSMKLFFEAVIFGPPFESFLFQFLPIEIGKKFTKNINFLIIISSILFSIQHPSLIIIPAFFMGIIFAWVYLIKSNKSKWNGFWIITSIHILHNAISFGIQYLFFR